MILTNQATASELFEYLTQSLLNALSEVNHPWRLPVLISSNEGRIVVLREVDIKSGTWTFFTDRRSTKVAQLHRRKGKAAATFYHPSERTQVRMRGTVLETSVKQHQEAWSQLKTSQKTSYATSKAPGSEMESADSGLSETWKLGKPSAEEMQAAFTNFLVYTFRVDKVELLVLNRTESRRCSWQSWNAEDYKWLVP